MSEPFVGQIMLAGFKFAPKGFAACDGQLLVIAQYSVLSALLGTVYGGDGRTTFQLPDLRGRTPLGFNGSYPLGAKGGAELVNLAGNQIPMHVHDIRASTNAGITGNPSKGVFGGSGSENLYAATGGAQVALNPASIDSIGSGQPHDNMQPFSVVNFCIALTGLLPPRD